MQKKEEKSEKSIFYVILYFLTRCWHGNDLQKVNNNTNDCENVTNLAAEFREHKSQGKKK